MFSAHVAAQTGLQFDPRSAQGTLIASLMAALAEFERCRDVLHTWGYQTTKRHARERLVGAQRYAAASTKLNGPRRALESWIPFSEQLIESGIENGARQLRLAPI